MLMLLLLSQVICVLQGSNDNRVKDQIKLTFRKLNINSRLGVSGSQFLRVPFLKKTRTRPGFTIPKNGNSLDDSLLCVFEHAEVLRHISSFMLRQVTRFPGFWEWEPYFKSLRIEIYAWLLVLLGNP